MRGVVDIGEFAGGSLARSLAVLFPAVLPVRSASQRETLRVEQKRISPGARHFPPHRLYDPSYLYDRRFIRVQTSYLYAGTATTREQATRKTRLPTTDSSNEME